MAATMVVVSVIIASFQSPRKRMPPRQITAATPARQPPRRSARQRIAAPLTNHGEPASTYSMWLITEVVNQSEIAAVVSAQFVDTQSTADCTPSAIQPPNADPS